MTKPHDESDICSHLYIVPNLARGVERAPFQFWYLLVAWSALVNFISQRAGESRKITGKKTKKRKEPLQPLLCLMHASSCCSRSLAACRQTGAAVVALKTQGDHDGKQSK